MKRIRERDYDPDLDLARDETKKPLWVEPIAPRSQRDRYGLPALIAVFLIAAFVIATISRFVAVFGPVSSPPTATPAITPISWVDTTAGPATSGKPGSPAPSRPAVVSISAVVANNTYVWAVGQAGRFTVELTNTSTVAISLSPCPTYVMYFLPATNKPAAVRRLLNCAAIGQALAPGQAVSLDMVYMPTADDPDGNQTMYWDWLAPDTIQASAVLRVYIPTPAATATP